MNLEKVIKFWQESSERDWEVANHLYKARSYVYTLFLCHLTLEKILKAIVVKKTKQHSPYTHDLVKLAFLAEIEINKTQVKQLEEISRFNIEARYDSIKMEFYKKATKKYTDKYFKISRYFYEWLKEKSLKQ